MDGLQTQQINSNSALGSLKLSVRVGSVGNVCSNIPSSPAHYSVYASHLIRCARTCLTYDQFLIRGNLLSTDKQLEVVLIWVSTVSFAGSFPQMLRSLHRSPLYTLPLFKSNAVSGLYFLQDL
jgi:hypothetical protein